MDNKENDKEETKATRCLRAIVSYAGGRESVAGSIGVTPAAISAWIQNGRIPSDHVMPLVALGDNHFRAEDLLTR